MTGDKEEDQETGMNTDNDGMGKGCRTRTLTEKAKKNKMDELGKEFWKVHNLYAKTTNESERLLKGYCTQKALGDMRKSLTTEFANVEHVYDALKEVGEAPDQDIRTGIDRLYNDKELLLAAIQLRINEDEHSYQSRHSSRVSYHSLHSKSRHSSRASTRSHHSRASTRSHQSSIQSSKYESHRSSASSMRMEAEANAAAHRAELEAEKEAAKKEDEIKMMELEESKRKAEAELTMQRKRRELEQHRIEKLLRMEEARVRVLKEDDDRTSNKSRLMVNVDPEKKDTGHTSIPNYAQSISDVSQKSSAPSNDIVALAEAITSSLSLNRIPAPEPSIFNGDPLQYSDWNVAFTSLIEEKALSQMDRLHYLKRYLSGDAKEAVSGFFLLQNGNAYEKAKAVLNERYGNPFIITEAFRDKLECWPIVQPHDGQGLRRFADFLQQCQAARIEINELGILDDYREIRKLTMKLPDPLVSRWNRMVVKSKKELGTYPNFERFASFIAEEASIACDPLTSVKPVKIKEDGDGKPKGALSTPKDKKGKGTARTLATSGEDGPETCASCERSGHGLAKCYTFGKLPLPDRIEFIKKKGLCFGCLKRGHMSKKCGNRAVCQKCQGRHPTIIHRDHTESPPKEDNTEDSKKGNPQKNTSNTEDPGCEGQKSSKGAICRKVCNEEPHMSSMIVPVWVSARGNPGIEHLVYALLDTQSDTTFVLEEVATKLEAQEEPARLKLTTMTSRDNIISCKRLKDLQVRGYYSDMLISLPITYTRGFIPTDRSHIPLRDTANAWPHLRRIAHLIPPLQECEVGLLIGYNCAAALAPKNFICGEGKEPFALETALGWSIIGGVDPHEETVDAIGWTNRVVVRKVSEELQPKVNPDDQRKHVTFITNTKIKEVLAPVEIAQMLEQDFKHDVTKEEKSMSQEDLKFLNIMKGSIYQDEQGHYTMPLPFKDEDRLSGNREAALRRLEQLLRRFRREPQFHEDYKAFMEEILARGDAERVPSEELKKDELWYIPHHGVYHPKKPGKIRVVFDCSARSQGKSLNDCLLQGPDLTNALLGVLLRFRQGKIAIMCDIEKMFHQFKVLKCDQDFLRFLWLDKDGHVADFRMKVHLFGATSSPSCANFGLHQVAEDYGQESPAAVKFIKECFYVDDGLISVDSEEDAVKLVEEAIAICSKGNLRLHKFVSNYRCIIESIPSSERAKDIKDINLFSDDLPVERALGIQWCVESDCFQFRLIIQDQPLTRRGILSTVASVYDPFGFVAPFILRGKQVLQQLCREGSDWDDPVSEEIRQQWEKWRIELPALANIKIKRSLSPEGTLKDVQIHHFSDASTMGYGQCSYLRTVDDRGQVKCSLLLAKSRVTPLKIVTIPRLELQAAVISARMSNILRQELELEATHHFWTDSKVVLGYISNTARRFHVFVANRVQKICELSKSEEWHYVATDQNPADHASRGLDASGMLTSNWFTGPSFLWESEVRQEEVATELEDDDPEVKPACVHRAKTTEEPSLLDRLTHISKWTRVVKVILLLQRYTRMYGQSKARSLEPKEETSEKKEAELTIIRMVQQRAFGKELEVLKETVESKDTKKVVGSLGRNSSIGKLNPFIDDAGILRVGGRLQRSDLEYEVRHPAILPKDGHMTQLIIRHHHEQVQHQGRGMTINEIRSNGIWIIGCSRAVSSYVYRCVSCRKTRSQVQDQKMADLPEERMTEAPPFTYCGMDCFGPFHIKERRKEYKRYGLLFTCMNSRAVHIEVLDDMSSDAFINALRCFIAIRGAVRYIRSDCGSNFVGAHRELKDALKEMDDARIGEFLANHNCDFVTNVPAASHMGGVWERQIRSIRSVLTAILLQVSGRLDFASLRTFLYEAMAIVNSRPLTVDNICDALGPTPITPNQLLTMKSKIIAPPPGRFERTDIYARKRWRRVQHLANEFWNRWRKEYLMNLQKRTKWTAKRRNIKVGDVVIVKDEDAPRCEWRLAIVDEATPDKDCLVRKVRLRMGDKSLNNLGQRCNKATYLERPIQKLVLLLESEAN